MTNHGVANPGQLAILSAALEDYCAETGIRASDHVREDVARHLLDLYDRGVDGLDDLKAALRAEVRAVDRLSA